MVHEVHTVNDPRLCRHLPKVFGEVSIVLTVERYVPAFVGIGIRGQSILFTVDSKAQEGKCWAMSNTGI